MTLSRRLNTLLLASFWGLAATPASASSCAEDIAAVDKALHSQYGEDRTWWQIIACPVVMDGQLRKDAVVNVEQIKEISYFRNIAYMQHARGDDKMCKESLAKPKRMLRVW
jgi:hypothetical protein